MYTGTPNAIKIAVSGAREGETITYRYDSGSWQYYNSADGIVYFTNGSSERLKIKLSYNDGQTIEVYEIAVLLTEE